MPTIEFSGREIAQGSLPPLCMRCGKKATAQVEKLFEVQGDADEITTRSPVGFTMGFIQSFGRPKLCLRAPFCAAHRGHWRRVKLLIVAGLVPVLLCLFSLAIVMVRWKDYADTTPGAVHGIAFLVLLFGWALLSVLVYETSLHPTVVEANRLVLKGVSDGFIRAVEQQRRRRKSGN
ncbi:MAG: hypothetical protein JNM56_20755 [Planctomycetia bacterium]|nr:hypothetical protein [Planctomycetia bacterium]